MTKVQFKYKAYVSELRTWYTPNSAQWLPPLASLI